MWIICGLYIDILVGGLNPSEKYEFVNIYDELPNIWMLGGSKCWIFSPLNGWFTMENPSINE